MDVTQFFALSGGTGSPGKAGGAGFSSDVTVKQVSTTGPSFFLLLGAAALIYYLWGR